MKPVLVLLRAKFNIYKFYLLRAYCSVYVFCRAERDKELEKRIKKHTEAMQERRRKPKGTPQQEMEAAMKELQVVSKYYLMYL